MTGDSWTKNWRLKQKLSINLVIDRMGPEHVSDLIQAMYTSPCCLLMQA